MKKRDIGSAVALGVGLIALGYGLYKTRKAKRAVKNVELTINKLADMTPVEISEKIIEEAAKKAAENAAAKAVETVREDIKLSVSASIYKVYDQVEETAQKKFIEAADKNIDLEEFSKKVEYKAATIVVEKFAKDLRGYAGPFMAAIINSVEKGG